MLQERILTYITKTGSLVSLEKLLSATSAKGFSEDTVLIALDKLGKKLKATVRGDTVYYSIPPPVKTPTDPLRWVRENYPRPDNFIMPWPEWDLGFMFLKTKEERDMFMAEMKGRPMVYKKKKYA